MHDMTPERVAQNKAEATAVATEVLEHLYRAILKIPAFTLKDGRTARVEDYSPPEINEDGEAECGIDVMLPDGHLEFTMRNSGWGKSFIETLKKPAKQGRQR
jgi:hypothetical protein